MWPESSCVNAVNLAKKNCYNSRDIEFFLGDYFFGAPCIHYMPYKTQLSSAEQSTNRPRDTSKETETTIITGKVKSKHYNFPVRKPLKSSALS